jgi:hypothetical protein
VPIPPDFVDECLYDPAAWFLVDADVFPDEGRVVGICDTTRIGFFVDAQRTWPGHDKHLPGAVAVQLTGTLGQLMSTYVVGLRATEGWVGFGTHIHEARFSRIGRIGPSVTCEARLLSKRRFRETVFTKIAFRYEQDGEDIYTSTQTAAWFRTDHRGPLGAPLRSPP